MAAVGDHEQEVDSRPLPVTDAVRLKSDVVLERIRPSLESLGYTVESGKRREQKIFRPVLFGDDGKPSVSYEIDAFHNELGIAVEVEAGRGSNGNADYRDIVRTALILDARFFALLMPITYHFVGSGKAHRVSGYSNTRGQLDAIYASQRLQLPFEGVLLLGY